MSGSAVTNDGARKAAYTAPSASAQAEAVIEAQRQAKIHANDVSYVECHATATLLGDGIEVSGLSEAFSKNRKRAPSSDRECPLSTTAQSGAAPAVLLPSRSVALGSIKGNIGHANCAAGITGLIKTMLCLHHKTLVPTVHYEQPNEKLQLEEAERQAFYINTNVTDWVLPPGVDKRVAGVSSFGIGGTNCHVVLEEYDNNQHHDAKDDCDDCEILPCAACTTTTATTCPHRSSTAIIPPPVLPFGKYHLLTFSAKSISSLRAAMKSMCIYLKAQVADGIAVNFAKIADVLHRGREAFHYRAAVVVSAKEREDSDVEDLDNQRGLASATAVTQAVQAIQEKFASISDISPRISKTPKVVLMFPGQGSQYVRMGRALYKTVAIYRRYMDECAQIVQSILNSEVDIRDEIYHMDDDDPPEADAPAVSTLTDPTVAQTSLFATEFCVAKTLQHCGVAPTALAGHSIGEYVASVIGGAISLRHALELVMIRARAARDTCLPGGMISVTMSPSDADRFVKEFNASVPMTEDEDEDDEKKKTVSVAAYNDPTRTVLAGSPSALALAHTRLAAQTPTGKSFKVRQLHVTNAFHSPLMAPAAAKVRDFIEGLPDTERPRHPTIPTTSNVNGQWMSTTDVGAGEYWANQITGPVRWIENVTTLMNDTNPTVFLEAGPGNTLSCFVSAILNAQQSSGSTSVDSHSRTVPTPPTPPPLVCGTMRHARNTMDNDVSVLLEAIGTLWEHGVAIDWEAYHAGTPIARVPTLPTYDWDEVSHWIHPERSIYVSPSTTPADITTKCARNRVFSNSQKYGHWLVRYTNITREKPAPRDVVVMLFCFTFAGGSTRAFESWASNGTCPRWADIIAVELFGRGSRADDVEMMDKAHEAEICADIIQAELDNNVKAKWALCGLSMGALVRSSILDIDIDIDTGRGI